MEPDTSNKLSYPKKLKQDEIPVLTIEALEIFYSMQLSMTRQENNPQGDACMVYGNDNTFITNAQPFKPSLLATKVTQGRTLGQCSYKNGERENFIE